MREYKTMIEIRRPDGTVQVVKPNMQFFEGNWIHLAQGITNDDFPKYTTL